MNASCDFLGRMWPHEKLDRLLADPGVMAAVEEMDCAGRAPGRGRPFQAKLARAWADAAGRSEPAFALLLLLRFRWFTLSSRRSV